MLEWFQNIGLYELTYSSIFLFALTHHTINLSFYKQGLLFCLILLLNHPLNPLIQTQWQIILSYIAIIVIYYFIQYRSFEKTLVLSVLTYFNLTLIDFYYLLLSQWISVNKIYFYLIFFVTSCVILLMLFHYQNKLINHLMKTYPQHKHPLLISLAMLGLCLIIPPIYQSLKDIAGTSQEIMRFWMAINITIFILFTIGSLIVYYGLQQIRKAERQLANEKINQEYNTLINQQYTEMRKFRHDYKNVILSLEGLIREKEWSALQNYFFKEIATDNSVNYQQVEHLNRLIHIQNPEIRNIFYSKLNYALSHQIPLQVEVSEELPKLDQHLMSLSRILGIILDNAIEESQRIEKPLIQVVITDVNDELLIMVSNRTHAKASQLVKMNQLGYSTKGDNRGFGLSNLKELANEANMLIYTSIENQKFIQELYIPIQKEVSNS